MTITKSGASTDEALNQMLEDLTFFRKLRLMPDTMQAVDELDKYVSSFISAGSFSRVDILISEFTQRDFGFILCCGFLIIVEEHRNSLPSYDKLFDYTERQGKKYLPADEVARRLVELNIKKPESIFCDSGNRELGGEDK